MSTKSRSLMPALGRSLSAFRFPLISIVIGLLAGGLIIYAFGHNGLEGVKGLIAGGFASPHALTTTLTRATPIIFAGLSSALAWGSGCPSMGIAGQMVLGAFTSAVVSVSLPGPPAFVLTVSLLSGMLAGALYAWIAAFISARFEVSLLIVTLMMNYLADNLASYLTTYVFRDPQAVDRLATQTQRNTTAILPRLFPRYTVHWGLILALVFTLVIFFIVRRTSFGYKARMSGLNPRFAAYGGVNGLKVMYLMMLLSGAMAGLGGCTEALGTRFRYIDGMITSPGYAWSGITAALMSGNHPLGVLAGAVFLAGLTTGGAAIELSMQVPLEITAIIQGILAMLVTARFAWPWLSEKLAARKTAGEVK